MKFAVVAQRSTPTNLALSSCLVPGVESLLLTPAQALARLGPGDVALGRLDVLHSLDGVEPGAWAFDALEESGCRLLNRRRSIFAAHDKRRTAKVLAAAGLPHPATQVVRRADAEVDLEPPFVVKPPFGSWGEDVVLCADRTALSTCLHGLHDRPWFRATGAVVQELVPPIGHDLRLVVAGRRVVGAIERVAPVGEWRTNVALGGIRRPVVPPPRACDLAVAAATASSQARGGGTTGRRMPPSATFVRHSPAGETRSIAPTTRRPATTSLRSWPIGGTSSWTTAPVVPNQALSWRPRRHDEREVRSAHRTTSSPQLPKGGLTTNGGSRSTSAPACRTTRVAG